MRLKTRPFYLPVICKGDDPFRKEANMRHKIIINVTNEKGQRTNALKVQSGKFQTD